MMAAGTAHDRAREHSTVTRSNQAELRRDGRRTRHPIKKLVAVSKRTAAGRARTGDFEIFSLALSQTELPRREASERRAGEIVFGHAIRLDSNRQIFHEFAADPYLANVLGLGEETDPVEWIFREREEIRVVPGLELSAFRGLWSEGEGPRRRRGFDGLKRFHSGLDEMAHLVAVEPPSGRSTGGREDIGPGRHPYPLANRDPQRLLVLLVDRHRLPVRIVGDPAFLPDANEAVDDEPGGHQDRVAREHQVRRFFVEERSVFDRPATGSERGKDAGFAMAVGGGDPVRAGRLRDDRPELLARELRMDRMVQLAGDPARRKDFDDPRSNPELHP